MVTVTRGEDPSTLDDLLTSGRVVGRRRVRPGAVDAIWSDPAMQLCYELDLPVIVYFDRAADAIEFERRIAACQGRIQ